MITSEKLNALFPDEALIPEAYRFGEPVRQASYLCGGELKAWNGPMRDVTSPIMYRQKDGSLKSVTIGSFPLMTAKESKEVLQAAVDAYDSGRGEWPTMAVEDRIICTENFINLIVKDRALIVRMLMWEIGKNLPDSEKEFDRTVEYIKQTIQALKELDNGNSRFQIVEGTVAQIRRAPLGVVLCMGPYNYPLNETFATLLPALIMGNTVVLKPPGFGILMYSPILKAFQTAFPKGVINTIYGQGSVVVPPIMESGAINVLTLIGSSKIANQLKKMHPKVNRLRAVLGLDAKNAAIVLPDADLDLAVKECLLGSLSFNGQRCTALKILLVHSSVVDDFIARFSKELEKLTVGMPWDKAAITPLPELAKVEQMTDYIKDAESKGAKVMNPGGGVTAGTLFYPAVVYPVNETMSLYREEQFGPVVPVMAFDQIETALDYVESSDHGQQVSIFSNNSEKIGALVDPLVNQVCRVNINCQCQRGPDVFPFTGRKDSAEGTLSVNDALRSFSIRSMIATKKTDTNTKLLDEIVLGNQSKFINTRYLF